ncbi:DUF2793 domain-containing protein (plasmid) [Pseudorhodobacter turbinis]|uniref:DUF2793 domain-containing protein n=1 Tax=Pseudorhodobacter turbinis TaxID=2500533 RepID=A0A4P8EJZ4_9RHOB|nr:DUF2793 domain-containing protein [Pseudorhodobacter turbinis]QCO57193.1 DUF2793 domain-containing protein [Pseudorhodobacter turbinis]
MSDQSARLSLPYLAPSQAQKHVTHNEALQILDLLVQPTVQAFGAITPPVSPLVGQVWALGAAPTGDWAGQPETLAAWNGDAWLFLTPQEGWQFLDITDGSLWRFGTAGWARLAPAELVNLTGVGINAGYDSTNRLSVSSAATLLTHEGAGHQLKINKSGASDTASLLFQTDWSGRAEMGTAGNDDFSIKVSPDGASWTNALSIAADTGLLTGEAITETATDARAGRLLTVGNFGLGSVSLPIVADVDAVAIPSGTYGTDGTTTGTVPAGGPDGILHHTTLAAGTATQRWQSALSDTMYHRSYRSGAWTSWAKIYDATNTTVDSNGFIKAASPILRLHNDHIEDPVEPVPAVFTRVGKGHYTLSGVQELADQGWQIEVPQDENGNRLVFVQTSYDAQSQTLEVKTSTVVWKSGWAAGKPVDIPQGRWIDLRFAYAPAA